jgi:uncharacterized membrane protein AbrB (regulator of aidB expression)
MGRRAIVREVTSTLVEAVGAVTVAYGLAQVYRPLGWILGGAFVALAGFSLSAKPGEQR